MSQAIAAPQNLEAEQAALGAALLSASFLPRMLDMGLRPGHFYREVNQAVFAAMTSLSERNAPVDVVTVTAEVKRMGRAVEPVYVDNLTGSVPMAANALAYTQEVIDAARWRGRLTASYEMQAAVTRRDDEGFVRATSALDAADDARPAESLDPERWGRLLVDYFEREEVTVWPFPFVSMTRSMDGGLRPGEVMLLAGYTSHGKSVLVDQMLDNFAKHGAKCHLYMTEMTAVDRGLRLLARQTLIPFGRLRRRDVRKDEWKKVLDAISALPYGCSIVADRSIDYVKRDVLRSRFDVVGIDLIHGFGYADERELDSISKGVLAMAKGSTTLGGGFDGTAVIAVAHLNDSQVREAKSPKRPKPGMQSIKGASSLKQDADVVCFVWLQDDDTGSPTDEGMIWTTKGRNAGMASIPVRLNAQRMRFEVLDA